MQNDSKIEKKIPVQNKPQSSFMLRFVKCPYCETKIDLKLIAGFECPECNRVLPFRREIEEAHNINAWGPESKKDKRKRENEENKSNQKKQAKKDEKMITERLIPGINTGSFIFVGKSNDEYMVIETWECCYHALRVVPEDQCPQDEYVQKAYGDKVVLIEEETTVIYPSQITDTKARLAWHIVMNIIDNHYKCQKTAKRKKNKKQSNEKREKKGDGLYVGNPWEGLSMTTHHIKVYRG